MNKLWVIAFAVFAFSAVADTNLQLSYGALPPFSDNPDLEYRIDQSSEKIIKLTATAGEYESASFYIKADEDEKNITLSISDLKSNDGSLLKKNIDLKYVQEWYQAGGAWNSHRVNRKIENYLVPELLVNDPSLVRLDRVSKTHQIKTKNKGYIKLKGPVRKGRYDLNGVVIEDSEKLQPIRLSKNEAKQIFLTIKIPENQSTGLYRGVIKVSSQDRYSLINVELDVLPFKLEASELLYSIYYRGKLKPGQKSISSEWKSEEQLEIELIDIYEHGVSYPTMYQRFYPKRAGEKILHHEDLFKKHLAIRKKVGISQEKLFYLGYLAGGSSSLENIDSFEKKIQMIGEVAEESGVEKIFFYGKEELPAKAYRKQKPAWDLVKKNKSGIFVALNKKFFSQEQEAYPDYLIFNGKSDKKYSDMAHEKNAFILSYSNPQVGVENPALHRKNYGFDLIRDNFDGVMNYAYQDSMGLMWVDNDHKNYRDLAFTYPTSNGVLGTLAWEAFREAIDDSRYFYTLKKLIEEAEVENQNVAMARRYLKKFFSDQKNSPDEDRAIIIQHILQVQKSL